MARTILHGFLAGFLAVLAFHQGMVWLLHAAGLLPAGPFSLAPVPPFGVPQVLSSAFWGGVWGVALSLLLAARPRWPALLTGLVLGVVGLNLVALTLVPALKGLPVVPPDAGRLLSMVLINGAWGWGAALLLLAAGARRRWPGAPAGATQRA
ncbi:MAG TPA: hypothetical protein VE684_08670 [Crenalkalicoccus sp.]|nr:hypothetical protein [Crenalkalicoccus sp.]